MPQEVISNSVFLPPPTSTHPLVPTSSLLITFLCDSVCVCVCVCVYVVFCCVILCVVCEEYHIINDDYIIIIF